MWHTWSFSALMNGKIFLFENRTKRDRIFDYLLLDQDYATAVQSYLEVILPTLCQLSKKLFKDHLPGGKICNLPKETIFLKCTPKRPCFAESVFGQMIQLLGSKPNIKTPAFESCIMFAHKK